MPLPRTAAVQMQLGRPELLVDGQPVTPMFYALTHWPGGRWSFEEIPHAALKAMTSTGLHLVQVEVRLHWLFPDDQTLDLTRAQKQVRGVLDACPDAAIVFRLHIDPSDAWVARHPEQWCRYADGDIDAPEEYYLGFNTRGADLARTPRPSLASEQCIRHQSELLRRFLTAFADTPEGQHVVGFHIAWGVYAEWHMWGFLKHEPDVGPAMTARFRRFLRDRYGTDAKLQDAWAAPDVTLDTAAVPGMDLRQMPGDGIFLDPVKHRPLIDYHVCQHLVVAEAIEHVCREVKTHWPRPCLTGVFYGYFHTLFGRQAAGGHLAIDRVLACPHLDYLSAPQSYWGSHRALGGGGQSRALLRSIARAGKLFLDEMDTQTSLNLGDRFRTVDTTGIDDDLAYLRRNVCSSHTRGHGLWFYDFGAYLGGWWNHPRLLAEIAALRAYLTQRRRTPFQSHADVLVVHDTQVFHHLARSWTIDCVSHVANDETTGDLYKSGGVFDDALLSRLPDIDLTPYRLVIFANTFCLTPQQRQFIRERVMTAGRHVLLNYLPGYTDGQRCDLRLVEDLTGFRLRRFTPVGKPAMNVRFDDVPETRLELWHPVPMPAIDDPDAEPLGWHILAQDPSAPGPVALAPKPVQDAVVYLSALPLHHSAVLRGLLRRAGCHLWCDAGDALLVGGDVLCLHTLTGGPRTLRFPDGHTLSLDTAPRSTTLLDLTTRQLYPGPLG
ncbi:MAG: hypothetical protein ACK4PI_11630 [Tepidisphaerales bacterium]